MIYIGLLKKGGGYLLSPFLLLFLCYQAFSLSYPPSIFAQNQNLLSGFNPATLNNRPDGSFFEINTFWADNPLTFNAIFYDQWDGPFTPKGKNWLDIFWEADSGFIYHGWRVAGFHRGEMFLKTNQDTVELLRTVNLKQDLTIGRRFGIDLQSVGFAARGLSLSKAVGLDRLMNGLSLGLTARYLKGEKIQDGIIKGEATPTGAKSYDFNLFIDYIYDDNLVYDRRDTRPASGDGYSFDLGFRYSFSQRLRAEILFRDILGRIYWENVPYTTAEATSDIKEYDADGYQVYRPTIQGYESYKDFTQKIPLKVDLALSYHRDPFTISPLINFIEERPIAWINLAYRVKGSFSLLAGYNLNYQAISLGISYRKISLRLSGTDTTIKSTRAIGLSFSWCYEW